MGSYGIGLSSFSVISTNLPFLTVASIVPVERSIATGVAYIRLMVFNALSLLVCTCLSNVFLTIFNIAVGIMAGSYALISEGAHTISDITTSIIAYIGFKIGSKPADYEHP